MGFNAKTGHFNLTVSMVRLWLQVNDENLQDTDAIAARLQECGVDVHEVRPAWVQCDMRPGAIWRALRGERPESSRIAHYWTRAAKDLYPTWATEELSGHMEVTTPEMVGSH